MRAKIWKDSKVRRFSIAFGVATFLVVLGWAAGHFQPHGNGSVEWLTNVNMLLLSPGYYIAGILAGLFLQGGIHSMEDLFWLAVPVSWLIYFAGAMFFLFFPKRWGGPGFTDSKRAQDSVFGPKVDVGR